MFDDLKDTFDAVFPRAMIWVFVWTALLALGTLGSAKAAFVEQPHSLTCAPMPEFMKKFASFDLKIIGKGNVVGDLTALMAQEKSGQWHFVILDPARNVGCVVIMGKKFKMLKEPLQVPVPNKNPKVMGPNDL